MDGVVFIIALLAAAGACAALGAILGLCIGIERGKRLPRAAKPAMVKPDADGELATLGVVKLG